MWTTDGYCIESYVNHEVLSAAVSEVHPKSAALAATPKTRNPLKGITKPDKVRISLTVCQATAEPDLDVLDLRERLNEVVSFIRISRTYDVRHEPVVAAARRSVRVSRWKSKASPKRSYSNWFEGPTYTGPHD
jgi:hypothetical protein